MQIEEQQIVAAQRRLHKEFYDQYNRPYKIPKMLTELETKLEGAFFYWHIYKALNQMVQANTLNRTDHRTKYAGALAFYYPKAVSESAKKHIKPLARLVDKYSHPNVSRAVGKHLEGLVKYELRVQGFNISGENTREYKDRIWTETYHELDIIAEHKTGKLTIGVEVKNTLGVMPLEEIKIKIRICNFLGITPVFAVRWIKPHAIEIANHEGFSWMFKTQIYPPGYEDMVKEIWNRIGLPVTVRTDLPPKTIPPFKGWLEKHLNR